MAGAALALGIIGTVTGLLSLGWNIAQHFLTSGRVKVELRGGWTNGHQLMSVPLKTYKRPEGVPLPDPILRLEVTNIGRLPLTVDQCAILVGNATTSMLNDPRNPNLPCQIGVGAQSIWTFDASDALMLAPAAKRPLQVKGVVAVAGRKKRTSKESIPSDRLAQIIK